MVSVSVEREVDVDRDRVDVTITISLSDLFDRNDELRLRELEGRNGYVRKGDRVAHYPVNTSQDEDEWLRKVRVGEQAIRDAVPKPIRVRRPVAPGTSSGGAHRREPGTEPVRRSPDPRTGDSRLRGRVR